MRDGSGVAVGVVLVGSGDVRHDDGVRAVCVRAVLVEGRRAVDVARECGVSAGTVRQWVSRARAELDRRAALSGGNVAAAEATLAALADCGRLEAVDAAAVEVVRSLAAVVDADPSDAALWRQYRDALAALTEGDDVADSRLEEALAQIRGAASVGDSQAP